MLLCWKKIFWRITFCFKLNKQINDNTLNPDFKELIVTNTHTAKSYKSLILKE